MAMLNRFWMIISVKMDRFVDLVGESPELIQLRGEGLKPRYKSMVNDRGGNENVLAPDSVFKYPSVGIRLSNPGVRRTDLG